jgi:flagellar motor switch protein FliM
MLVLVIEATMGDCMEQINIGFPYTTLEPLVRQISQRMATAGDDAAAGGSPDSKVKWRTEYADVPIGVTAQWNGLRLLARELAGIKPGEVIPLPSDFADNIHLHLAGQARFLGRLGTTDGRWAVEVSSAAKA